MRPILSAAALLALLAAVLLAAWVGHCSDPPAPDPRHVATRVPDRVVLTWDDDPARSQAVTWRTDTSVAQAVAEFRLAGDGRGRVARAMARTEQLQTANGAARFHTARLTGLRPASVYAYRVGDGRTWSEWQRFRTASATPEPFGFLYFGDVQDRDGQAWQRLLEAAVAHAPDARLIVHAGDLVNLRGDRNDSEWGTWHAATESLAARLPVVPAVGNHEYLKERFDRHSHLSPHWNRQFALPADGPEGLEESVYSTDYQGVRFIVLNSLHALAFGSVELQARWLESRLRHNPNRWTVVVYHHPMFAMAEGRESPEPLQEHWKPLFERYGVDLVLQGHDHVYSRVSTPGPAGVPERDAAGPVYVVSVAGPKMYDLAESAGIADVAVEDVQLFQLIRVDDRRLRFEARSIDGEIHDAFELVRDEAGAIRLVERPGAAPPSPPRLGS
jgi:acid phosphatase type 7